MCQGNGGGLGVLVRGSADASTIHDLLKGVAPADVYNTRARTRVPEVFSFLRQAARAGPPGAGRLQSSGEPHLVVDFDRATV